MSKFNVECINCVTVGNTEKIINADISYTDTNGQVQILKSRTFVCGIDGTSESFGKGSSNKYSVTSNTNDIIHPLYDIADLCIKSTIKKVKNSVEQYKNNSQDFIDIYAPDITNDDIIGISQIDDYAYVLTNRTNNGTNTLRTNLTDNYNNSSFNSRYYFVVSNNNLPTFLYNNKNTLDDNRVDSLSDYFKPRFKISNVKYNYILEIPQNLGDMYNDYDSGDIQGDVFQGKNLYDSLYSVNMTTQNNIHNTRDYIDICNCSNVLFMKYYDNINYTIITDKETQKTDGTVIDDVVAIEQITKYPYQKIETLDSINRFKSNIRHKSGLFSINILNSGINNIQPKCVKEDPGYEENYELAEQIKNNIKQDIKNQIRDITNKICPAQTQLFDVYFVE